MPLAVISKAGKVIETLENYSVNSDTNPLDGAGQPGGSHGIYSDEHFWESFLQNPEAFWNKQLDFYFATISEWVARVPGLYWSKGAEQYRNPANSEIQFTSEAWKTYTPQGKSSIVMGGVGDFVLPPDDQGKTIMTISASNNASTGVPVLIYPEVLEKHQLKQGDSIRIRSSYWRKMSQEWSSRFPSADKVKRGYLVVDDPDNVEVIARNQPVEFHPCTIMEYNSGNALLYDFVFCTADTAYANHRKRIEAFFEKYRTEKERYGKYLIAADSTDPLFEASYNTPYDLIRAEPGGKSQLSLLTERIQNSFYHRGETIDTLLDKIPKYYPTSQQIQALVVKTGIPQQEIQVSSAANMSAQLVDTCIDRKKLELLVDCILIDYPELINQ